MQICTEPQRPDGYNGIIETNLTSVHAMAVDYPHKRICFALAGYATVASPASPAVTPAPPANPTTSGQQAWTRFNSMRPPQ